MEKPKTIQVIGRRWFDKVNGNTYHSSEVYTDNVLLAREPFAYGYGEAYIQTATSILKKHIDIPENISLWRYCDEHNIKLLTTVSDGLKRDL